MADPAGHSPLGASSVVALVIVIGLALLHLFAIACYTVVRRKVLVRPMVAGTSAWKAQCLRRATMGAANCWRWCSGPCVSATWPQE